MVKVLPHNFTLVDSQRILSPAGEPLAITCSNDLLFIAVEECKVEAYDLCTLDQLAQFRTVSPVTQIAYNVIGDCVVTLEKKHPLSHGFVRVYFKWRGLSADKPMRIRMASSVQRSVPGHGRVAAEIVELPSDSGGSVSCLACCEYTGRIAVAMGSLLRIFYLEREEEQSNDLSSFSLRPSVAQATSPLSPSHSLPLPLSPSSSSTTPNIEILLDIQTNTPQLEMVSIVGDYVAFISTNEVRVVKLSLFHSRPDPIPDYEGLGNRDLQLEGGVAVEGGENSDPCSLEGGIVRDRNFILWSPSVVWEAEKRASCSSADHVTSPETSTNHRRSSNDITGDHMTSGNGHVTPPSPPLVGTVHLKSITEATSEKLSDRATMEVLGPVEYVWGQPLTVTVNHVANGSRHGIPECRVLTMLYRRFSAEVSGSGFHGSGFHGRESLETMSLARGQRATQPVRVHGGRRLGGEGGWDGLHSIKLIPTFAPGSESDSRSRSLVGVSCFLANRFHSYLYDVHRRCRLLSSFSFMTKSRLASCDGWLLHALSDESVETYTSRVFQAAVSNLPRGSAVIPPSAEETDGWAESMGGAGSERGCGSGGEGEGREGGRGESAAVSSEATEVFNHTNCLPPSPAGSGGSGDEVKVTPDPETWLRQPIPPHSLDLTLVSSSKFIGCCYLATSQDYIIVVTKGEADQPSPSSSASWLLQSLTLRKAKAEQLWNIYILKLKSPISLYHQFMEFAETMKETSPPMRQHLLSEAHTLLRRQIIQHGCTTEVMRWLQDNCFQLAESLCLYSRWNGIETHASHYFIMSGRPIVDIVRHILSHHKSDHKLAYAVLMAYLNLTLFEPRNAEKQIPLLRPLADKVLDLYAGDHVTQRSGHVIQRSGHVTQRSGHVTQKSGHVTCHVISLLLDSWLVDYSRERALSVLETQLESISGEERCRGRMCHAMLCLQSGREREARQGVRQVTKEDLRIWLPRNLRLVLDLTNLTLTLLGKLVLEVEESSLLNLFLLFLKNQKMTFDDLCTLLKTEGGGDLAQEHTLKHFLEMIVLDRSKVISKATTTKAIMILVEILFARLLTEETTVPHPSSRKQAPFVMQGTRHRWLDNVVPFGGGGGGGVEEEEEREGETRNHKEPQRRKHDYRLHDLLQLQTLLCSSHMTETVATRVDELMTSGDPVRNNGEGEGEFFVYRISLQMLSWPHLGRKKEACTVCLDHCPGTIIDYCQTMFPDDLDLWVWLLEQLLGNAHYEGDPTPLQDLFVSLYKEALGHVITLTTPQQFISLLPPTGSADFFLPFIERSFKLHFSRTTSDYLHQSILESSSTQ